MRKKYTPGIKFNADGVIKAHTIDTSQKQKRHYHKETPKDECDVCLTCTQKNCSGTRACMKNRKKKLEEKELHHE